MKIISFKIFLFILFSIFPIESYSFDLFSNESISSPENNNDEFSILVDMLGGDKEEISKEIETLYSSILDKQPIKTNENFAKFSLLLKHFTPLLCQDSSFENASSYNDFFELYKSHLNKNSLENKDLLSDIDSLNNGYRIEVNNQVLSIMILSKIACFNFNNIEKLPEFKNKTIKSDASKTHNDGDGGESNDNHDDNSNSPIDPFSGTEMTSGTVIINDGFNGSNDFEEKVLAQFEGNELDIKEKKKIDISSINENGFLEVDDNKIPDIDEYYSKNKNKLSSFDDIKENISFYPEILKSDEYRLLGVSPSGVADENGLASSLVSLYETPLGKMLINEEDLTSSNAIVSLDKDYLNIEIGGNPASLITLKGSDDSKFVTEIYWVDNTKNRAYSVEINENLNNESNKKNKEKLVGFLNNSFGNTAK